MAYPNLSNLLFGYIFWWFYPKSEVATFMGKSNVPMEKAWRVDTIFFTRCGDDYSWPDATRRDDHVLLFFGQVLEHSRVT